jgi:pimeloyl-ACP methyl ester carboxylesterase
MWPHGPVTIASTLVGNSIAAAAAAILDDAPPRFALAGISMGGYLCFEILRQAPDRVLKLALIDTAAQPDTADQTANRRAALKTARASGFLPVALANLTGLLHPDRRADPELAAINRRMALAVGLDGFARQLEIAISRPDSRPILGAIDVDTVVIVGDSDPLTPVERSQEIASAVSGSKLVVIPECGHLSPLEQPQAVSRALVEWIAA